MPLSEDDATGVAALADPVRRRLYLYVCAQPSAVSREQAANAVAVPVHQAKFHLDKLEAEGLLETEYARLGERRGPGAGRPSKLYRRAAREINVSLPDREYELAGRLMANAIAEAESTCQPVMEVLDRLAVEHGSAIGRAAIAAEGRPDNRAAALTLASEALSRHGYEPRAEQGRIVLINCPFHSLAQTQTALVCGMNHALIRGLTATMKPYSPVASLEPHVGRCCVVLRAGTSAKRS